VSIQFPVTTLRLFLGEPRPASLKIKEIGVGPINPYPSRITKNKRNRCGTHQSVPQKYQPSPAAPQNFSCILAQHSPPRHRGCLPRSLRRASSAGRRPPHPHCRAHSAGHRPPHQRWAPTTSSSSPSSQRWAPTTSSSSRRPSAGEPRPVGSG
jgi:hypothetical protein